MAEEAPRANYGLELLAKLEKRSYDTYMSRLYAYKRLSFWNLATNNLLVAFSTSTTIASVGILVKREMYGVGGDALMVALAIVSLVLSLVVASSNYATRAKTMEVNYKEIQRISLEAEALQLLPLTQDDLALRAQQMQERYNHAVDASENHEQTDYLRMQKGKEPRRTWAYLMLLIPLVVIIPFSVWFASGF